ncbi:hypothetical protein KSP39_PZI019666 [Platanthera zijinensis]|uniref:Uncharacterized protein n=1 Tax=Platanthera zijinensis TaxID=2320716 RepID=A0AAP0B2D8_9ASPA
MKSSLMSSAASSKTPGTTATAVSSLTAGGGRDRSEGRSDSNCYFPGCRKDTNCKCKICLASINATRDLIPSGSSVSNVSYLPKREPSASPTTPNLLAATSSFSLTPPIESTAKSRRKMRGSPANKDKFRFLGHWKAALLLGIFLVTTADLRFLKGAIDGFGPALTKETLEKFGEECRDQTLDLRGRLRILELKIGGVVDGVLNCSSLNSSWEMNQFGSHFFYWRCVIYESMMEEVSVWGSPLRTSGLLSTGFSSPSLALLSGRIIEWSDGKLEPIFRTGNGSSWTLQRWMAVAVHLESDTWVLEYKRNVLFDDHSGFLVGTLGFLRQRAMSVLKLAKREPWRILTLGFTPEDAYHHRKEDDHFMCPT